MATDTQEAIGISCARTRHHFLGILHGLFQIALLLLVQCAHIGSSGIPHFIGEIIHGFAKSLVGCGQTFYIFLKVFVAFAITPPIKPTAKRED